MLFLLSIIKLAVYRVEIVSFRVFLIYFLRFFIDFFLNLVLVVLFESVRHYVEVSSVMIKQLFRSLNG